MKLLIGVAVLLALAGGAFAATRPNKKPANIASAGQSNVNQSTITNTSTQQTENTSTVSLVYTDNGFSPSTLTIKAGTTLAIKNESSRELQFSSDPHPQHTDDPELNLDVIESGQSQTITVTVTGTHGYHNHLDPADIGSLIVE